VFSFGFSFDQGSCYPSNVQQRCLSVEGAFSAGAVFEKQTKTTQTAKLVLSRNLILGRLLVASVGLSGRFSGSAAACTISQLRQVLRCERVQHKKRIHTLGSRRSFAAARSNVTSAGQGRNRSRGIGAL